MTLHLLHLPVRQRALMQCGRQTGLIGDTQAADLGYLLHGLFRRLAEAPPVPFDIQPPAAGDGLPVLAYSGRDHVAFRDGAAARGDAAALAAVDWQRADSKQMPELGAGQVARFRVRVCPTIRVGRGHPQLQAGAEVDPYLALRQRDPDQTLSREAVYRDWFAGRMGDAARLLVVRLAAQRDAHLWRKGEPKPGPARTMYGVPRARHGPRRLIGRREAVFEGTLQVADAAAFAALLARGVGRHRAFGFGMLLLRSAGRDAEG